MLESAGSRAGSPRKILISAGEASGDNYASMLVDALREEYPEVDFFGCAGPKMRRAGVRAIVRSESLAVVGLVEVIGHIPRIYGEYRRLLRAAEDEKPDLAILTDSPDFHLRVARRLAAMNVPVVYFVAPQVWAWRKDRLPLMRRVLRRLLCIFPFEEKFFTDHGVSATYIGHPLAGQIHPSMSREAFFAQHGLDLTRPLVALLPGSRKGEAARHLPYLVNAAQIIAAEYGAAFVLPASSNTGKDFFDSRIFGERNPAASIKVIEGQAWDALAHADVALAASGTVTVEAALLGTPMVVFYRVTAASWLLGKMLVRIPFYCMVNLIAGHRVVPELIQSEMTPARLAEETGRLLADPARRDEMRHDLQDVAAKLTMPGNAIRRAVEEIRNLEGVRVDSLA